jgi:small subunit ribosomal protein S1
MMSEGTSIGKVENIEDFDVKDQDVPSPDNELKATKIGEMSEFEKSFISETDEKAPESQEDSAVVADEAQESTAKKSLKSELEKFLDEETAQVFDYEDGDVIIGTVRSVEKSGVLVDFKFKSDGYVSNSELGHNEEGQVETLEAGQKVPFYIEKLETKEGYSLLSRKKAQMEETWDFLTQAIKEREPINVQVNSKVDGGLVASYQSIKGFIPASQILKENDLGLEQFINSTMSVTVLQADRRRRKVIFSSKATKLVDRKSVNKIIEELEVGQIRKGKVTSIKKFGVFVDLGGVEGLIHISELSWSRVYNPSDIVSVDDEVDVFVLGVDKETKRISLGMKQLSEDPWVKAGNELAIGDVVEGQITRIVPFGAFIQINENIEGLIHISEISYEHIEKVESILNIGDSVKAKVIKLIIEEQKNRLNVKV